MIMESLTVSGSTAWRNDYLADLSRLHCSGVFADVRLHAGRGEDSKQTIILTNSLLLASMMEEGNKGEDGFWDIIIPEAISLDLQATFQDLMTWTPRKESIIVLEDLFLLKPDLYLKKNVMS